jgi:hypothetical protein
MKMKGNGIAILVLDYKISFRGVRVIGAEVEICRGLLYVVCTYVCMYVRVLYCVRYKGMTSASQEMEDERFLFLEEFF